MKKPTAKKIKKVQQGIGEYKVWTIKTDFKWPETITVPVNLEKGFLERSNTSLCEVVKWAKAFELGYKCAGGKDNTGMTRLAKNIENIADLHEVLQVCITQAGDACD